MNPPITLEQHEGITVLRDDLLPGGTKSRFLRQLLPMEFAEFVYASPVYGGFQIALAAVCQQLGKQATIFCALRKTPHPNTLAAKVYGARIYQVPAGYLSNVEAQARAYAEATGAYKLKFGANYPEAISAIATTMVNISAQMGGEPDQVWCAYGSGTLTKGILAGTAFSEVHAVEVGMPANISDGRLELYRYPRGFDKLAKITPPFTSCANYDAKAWEVLMQQERDPKARILFWNVL